MRNANSFLEAVTRSEITSRIRINRFFRCFFFVSGWQFFWFPQRVRVWACNENDFCVTKQEKLKCKSHDNIDNIPSWIASFNSSYNIYLHLTSTWPLLFNHINHWTLTFFWCVFVNLICVERKEKNRFRLFCFHERQCNKIIFNVRK